MRYDAEMKDLSRLLSASNQLTPSNFVARPLLMTRAAAVLLFMGVCASAEQVLAQSVPPAGGRSKPVLTAPPPANASLTQTGLPQISTQQAMYQFLIA